MRGKVLQSRWESLLVKASGASRHLDRGRHEIALTFDDGPHPVYTPLVLDELARARVLATFFWTGSRAQNYPDVAQQVRRAGHAVGSHSFAHLAPAHRGFGEIAHDYRSGRRSAEALCESRCDLFRPPYGAVSLRSAGVMRLQRLVPWLWSVDPKDWVEGATTEGMLRFLECVSAGDVILLHDGCGDSSVTVVEDRSATVKLIVPLVEMLTERGLSFVTLDEVGSCRT